MTFNQKEINHLMHARRSVFPKDYSGETVPDHVIDQMLENANHAPTHKLTEPWRFVVFARDGRKALAAFQSECYKQVTSASGTFQENRYLDLQTKPMESSHIIAIGMKRDASKRLPEWEELGAVFCAIQNMYLTATAYGVGCYLSTGGITTFEEAKTFFGLGADDKLCGFMQVGMPKGEPSESRRKPIADKVNWVTEIS
ncbi:MAG: nitroreductase [Cyclobacteriaceae bacterium]|jgi:nitroreductase|nr:nitroreductase [Cyclobacteriaceae bacterium]